MCAELKEAHKSESHQFKRHDSLPQWHGWHSFRRGLATNLHRLGVEDKEIQAILRHSNIGITQNIYVKSVAESQVDAMDLISGVAKENMQQPCNVRKGDSELSAVSD